MSNVNDALSSLYLELPGEVAADVNGIVRNHIANLDAEIARCKEIAERDGRDYAKLSNELTQLRAECDRLREALGDAARSLEGIRSQAGLDPYLETMQQVRGFAESRAIAAHAALTQREGGDHESAV